MTCEVNLDLEIYSPLLHWLWKTSAEVSIVLILPPECESTNWIGLHITPLQLPIITPDWIPMPWPFPTRHTLSSSDSHVHMRASQVSTLSDHPKVGAEHLHWSGGRWWKHSALQKPPECFFSLQKKTKSTCSHKCRPSHFMHVHLLTSCHIYIRKVRHMPLSSLCGATVISVISVWYQWHQSDIFVHKLCFVHKLVISHIDQGK